MPATDDDELEGLFESDDDERTFFSEDDDEAFREDEDEADDDERFGEARRAGVPRPVRVSHFQRPPRRNFNLKGQRQGMIQTPGGQASVNLGRSLATTAEVKEVADRLSKDIANTAAGVARLETAVKKIEKANRDAAKNEAATLAKFEKTVAERIRKTQQSSQQNMLLPLLLTPKPQIDSLTFASTPAANTPVTVSAAKFKSDTTSDLLPFLLLGGMGGTGGNGGSGTDLFSSPLGMFLMIKLLG